MGFSLPSGAPRKFQSRSQGSFASSSLRMASTKGGIGQSSASAMARNNSASRSVTRPSAATVLPQASRMFLVTASGHRDRRVSAASTFDKQGVTADLPHLLKLMAHGRLGNAKALAGCGDAAGFDHGHQQLQHFGVKV